MTHTKYVPGVNNHHQLFSLLVVIEIWTVPYELSWGLVPQMLVLFCKAVESLESRAYLVNIGHFRVDHRISPRLPMLDTSRAVLGDKPLQLAATATAQLWWLILVNSMWNQLKHKLLNTSGRNFHNQIIEIMKTHPKCMWAVLSRGSQIKGQRSKKAWLLPAYPHSLGKFIYPKAIVFLHQH